MRPFLLAALLLLAVPALAQDTANPNADGSCPEGKHKTAGGRCVPNLRHSQFNPSSGGSSANWSQGGQSGGGDSGGGGLGGQHGGGAGDGGANSQRDAHRWQHGRHNATGQQPGFSNRFGRTDDAGGGGQTGGDPGGGGGQIGPNAGLGSDGRCRPGFQAETVAVGDDFALKCVRAPNFKAPPEAGADRPGFGGGGQGGGGGGVGPAAPAGRGLTSSGGQANDGIAGFGARPSGGGGTNVHEGGSEGSGQASPNHGGSLSGNGGPGGGFPSGGGQNGGDGGHGPRPLNPPPPAPSGGNHH